LIYKNEVLKSCLVELLFICISASIVFAYSGGTGDSNSPYQIGSVSDWQQLMGDSNNWNKHFIMIADVNLQGVTLTPVGISYDVSFAGVFEGNNHIIRNVEINMPSSSYVGLFGCVNTNGQIRNLGIEDVNITGSMYVGGLAGYSNGLVTNCYTTGTVTGSNAKFGGLVGWNSSQSIITDCYSACKVTGNGSSTSTGGLVGQNRGSIINSYASGMVFGVTYVGGLVGGNYNTYSDVNITGCYATGTVTGSGSGIGGLVGSNYYGTQYTIYRVLITGCYATGTVSGGTDVGGLIGYNDNYDSNSSTARCHAAGSVTGNGHVGGLIGYYNKGVITDCNATGAVTGSGSGTIYVGGLIGYGTNFSCADSYAAGAVTGNGSGNSSIIYVGGLIGSGSNINNCYATGAVIGNGSGTIYVGGLIGYGSHINNCYATDSVTGNGITIYVGGLAGSGGIITYCHAAGSVTGTGRNFYIGGLVGDNSTISNSYAAGNVVGNGTTSGIYNSIGGLTGCNEAVIQSSYAIGTVTANGNGYCYAGGLVGINTSTTYCCPPGQTYGFIQNCFAAGRVAGTNSDIIGGLVGKNYSSSTNTNISKCYSTGQVVGSGTAIGGLVGQASGGEVISSYWDVNTSGRTTSVGGTGKTTAQMKTLSTYFGWDFTTPVWEISDGISYPELAWQTDTVTVPNVVSMTLANAENAIVVAELAVGLIINSYSDTVPAGIVISHSPAVGIVAPRGAPVSIVVSIGSRYSGGFGTAINPYQIAAVSDWNNLMNTSADWNKYFIMTADVNLQGISLTPLGNTTTQFTGVFNGNNHIIRNAVIHNPATDYIGLFGYLGSSAQVRNLGVEDVNITGNLNVGGLAGYNYGSISNCYSRGTIRSNNSQFTGGLVGQNYHGNISNCYSTSAVSGYDIVGGLVGYIYYGSITNCYSNSTAGGASNIGGLAGYNNSGSISNCYSTGAVSGSFAAGGLVGYSGGTINNSFWDVNSSGRSSSAGGTGKTTAEMKTESTFTSAGWDFSYTDGDTADWLIRIGEYPILTWQVAAAIIPNVINMTQANAENALVAAGLVVGAITNSYNDTVPAGKVISQSPAAGMAVAQGTTVDIVISLGSRYSGGLGTEANPYQIAAVSDWNNLLSTSADWSKHFVMTADVSLQGIALTPIGNYDVTSGVPFSGVFDGDNHIIKNVNIYMPDSNYIGLFGYLGSGAQVRNLGVEDVNITAKSRVGGLVGLIGTSGGTVSNCYTTGRVTGYSYVGGLVGRSFGNITECYSTCIVNGTNNFIGGLVGYQSYGSYEGVITSCYAAGAVDGNDSVGGLVGWCFGGAVTKCYSAGLVNGTTNVGGLVGTGGGTINNSFWDVNSSGQTTSDGGTGKTTPEMKTESTFTSAGWDFSYTDGNDAVWYMAVEGYPILTWQISPADLYTDGKNDFRDFAVFARYWMRDDCRMYNHYCDWADLNFDGVVDIDDLAIFMTYWLQLGIYE
jgi:hypothetical protein